MPFHVSVGNSFLYISMYDRRYEKVGALYTLDTLEMVVTTTPIS